MPIFSSQHSMAGKLIPGRNFSSDPPLMTAADFLDRHVEDQRRGDGAWLAISELADAFRGSSPSQRLWMAADPPRADAPWDALLAGVVEDLCEEVGMTPPPWTIGLMAQEPMWVWPNITEEV